VLHHVAIVRIDVSEECSASIIRVTRIGELGATLAVTSNRRTLRRNTNINTKTNTFYIFENDVIVFQCFDVEIMTENHLGFSHNTYILPKFYSVKYRKKHAAIKVSSGMLRRVALVRTDV
jgi:hypothetical protein